MSQQIATLLLGSNLNDRSLQLTEAKNQLKELAGTLLKEGEITETEPVEFSSPHLFLNQIISIKTELPPLELLKAIKRIEVSMGRIYTQPLPGEKYTSRIIDIDILFYNNLIFDSKTLKIPHPQVYSRKFVQKMLERFQFISNC